MARWKKLATGSDYLGRWLQDIHTEETAWEDKKGQGLQQGSLTQCIALICTVSVSPLQLPRIAASCDCVTV